MSGFKNIILWNYPRGTWAYDVFCGLIILFIFATPKYWFEKQNNAATQATRFIVKAADVSANRQELEKRIRSISGNPDAEIIGINEKKDETGQSYYEIEIR